VNLYGEHLLRMDGATFTADLTEISGIFALGNRQYVLRGKLPTTDHKELAQYYFRYRRESDGQWVRRAPFKCIYLRKKEGSDFDTYGCAIIKRTAHAFTLQAVMWVHRESSVSEWEVPEWATKQNEKATASNSSDKPRPSSSGSSGKLYSYGKAASVKPAGATSTSSAPRSSRRRTES
jgi:hypothetical protein